MLIIHKKYQNESPNAMHPKSNTLQSRHFGSWMEQAGGVYEVLSSNPKQKTKYA